MKPRKIYSKYQCDNKLKIYTDIPLSNSQYQKMIENAKPRYMNDYYNAPKYNQRKEEKSFNNLLNTYYNDYKKLKNKYNFIEDEPNEEEYQEEENNFDYNNDEYQIKRRNLNLLFLSNDSPDMNEIKFDITDKIINTMYNGKNDSLLKNTQTKDDYILRLNYIKKDPSSNLIMRNDKNNTEEKSILEEDEMIVEGEDQNSKLKKDKNENDDNNTNKESNNNNQIDENEIFYLDDEKQDENNDDNYLILKYNNNSEEFPKFEDIINSNYNKEYQPPLYEIPKSVLIENEKNKNKEIEKENLYEEQKRLSINKNKEGELKNIEDIIRDNNEEEEKDKENDDKSYNDFENNKIEDEIYEEDDNNLKLIDNNDNLVLFDDIISNDFKREYTIPIYKIPDCIQKEIKNEEQKNESDIYKNDNKLLEDKENENQNIENTINQNNKIVYNPPESLPKNENEENKNKRYSLYKKDS
jgi:hypothetical protein